MSWSAATTSHGGRAWGDLNLAADDALGQKLREGSYNDDDVSADGDAGLGESATGGEAEKKKSTRGSRACTVCRKLKMRCVGAEEGPPCKRCKSGGHECVFEESMRGRRTNRKTDAMAKSLKKMEATLETVLKSISSAGGTLPPAISQALASGYSPLLDAVDEDKPDVAGLLPPQHHSHSFELPPHHSPVLSLPTPLQAPPNNFGPPGATRPRAQSQSQSPMLELGHNDVPGIHQVDSSGQSGAAGSARKGKGRENPRLHSLPDNTLNPLGLLAEASLQNHTLHSRKRANAHSVLSLHEVLASANGDVEGEDEDEERQSKKARLGVANARYFQPGPMNNLPLRRIVIEHRMPPELLVEKIVTPAEVVELFSIFFDKCHSACPILDPEIHTPTATGSRSPFLFTCICSVAARYYTKRTDDLYRKCLKVAKRVAFDVMTKGFKSTEICQGFLLLCQWNQPAERFEEERTYQFSGIAVRMATDLNLHRKTLAVMPDDVPTETRVLFEREIHNRERTYLYCFIADRSVSNQMGKPYSIQKEDFLIRSAKTWFSETGAQTTDGGLAAMVEMHRIIGRIVDTLYSDTTSVSGLNQNLDYPLLMRSFLAQLDQWKTDWEILRRDPLSGDERPFSVHMRDFYHSYYRLFVLSFAVQHALDNPAAAIDLPRYCILCFESCQTIIRTAADHLGPQGHLRYAIDSSFVFLSYACCFLLKLVNPTFKDMIDTERAMALVQIGADALANAAVDDSHTPALYASFLRTLIDNKMNGGRTAPGSRSGTTPSSPVNGALPTMDSYLRSRQGSVAPENLFSWSGETGIPVDQLETGLNDFGYDASAMDTLLQDGSSWWSTMLMPGFGGPLHGLSGGATVLSSNPTDPWAITPLQSRAGSPNGMTNLHGFDFAQP